MRTLVFGRALAIAVLVATVLAWGTAAAQEVDPLTLELTSSRELCTANTLTELSWIISGGRPPYTLSIDGETVDAAAESHRVNCGAIPADPMGPVPGTTPTKTFRASVTDSQATPVTATDAVQVELAEALPAPTGIETASLSVVIGVRWTPKPAPAEGVSRPARFLPQGLFLVRHRLLDADSWTYELRAELRFPWWIVLLDEGTRELMFAELRDPLEAETPEALDWSAATRAATHAPPENLTATATHNTVTVTWQRQPDALKTSVFVRLLAQDPYDGSLADFVQETGVTGDASVTFEHLPPDAEFVARVEYGDDVSASVSVRTTAAPDGYDYAAIPQGAQNLRATLSDTGTRITVTWDDPYPGNENHYDAHLIDVETGRRLDRADIVLAGTNSWSTTGSAAFGRVRLGREYRVYVGHDAIPFTEASILVTTPDLPPSSRAAARAAAQNVDPLTLELASSRALCTANTLTELSWSISGGIPPYTLSIDGETVAANAESHRANCGPIPTDPLSGDPLPGPTKTFTATVTDSQSPPDPAMATVAVDLAPPLRAPQNLRYRSYVDYVLVFWDEVAGAGADSPSTLDPASRDGYWTTRGTLRTRLVTDEAWTYQELEGRLGVILDPLPGLRILQTAVVRHPLELETPEALSWTEELTYAATSQAQNVRIEATHDTVTVSWDRQPYAMGQDIRIYLFNTSRQRTMRSWEEPGLTGRHEVIFTHVPPDQDYQLTIFMLDAEARTAPPEHTLRTLPPPPGWTAPPRGAQNLRATFSADHLTITWDLPYPGVPPSFWLQIENADTGQLLYTQRPYDTTNWEIPLTRFLRSASRYRITVRHNGLVSTVAEIVIQRPAASAAAAQEVDPLTLELTSSRDLCTANTLTELSWIISGGRPPYTLSIDGETVAANAESHRVNCGAIPADPMGPVPGTTPAKTFRASITDSQATPSTASASTSVDLAPPLPAPSISYTSHEGFVIIGSDWNHAADHSTTSLLIRFRETGADAWDYALHPSGSVRRPEYELSATLGDRAAATAAMRDVIESETPGSLNWSDAVRVASAIAPQNVRATATHDTIAVSWDKQPYMSGQRWVVSLTSDSFNGVWSKSLHQVVAETGRQEIDFPGVAPDTTYIISVRIAVPDGKQISTTTVSTSSPPPGWMPPPRGPQNLRATTAHDSITVSWDLPYPGARDYWLVRLFEESSGNEWNFRFIGSEKTWTIRSARNAAPLKAATSYRILVSHVTLVSGDAEIIVTTDSAPPVSSRIEAAEPSARAYRLLLCAAMARFYGWSLCHDR